MGVELEDSPHGRPIALLLWQPGAGAVGCGYSLVCGYACCTVAVAGDTVETAQIWAIWQKSALVYPIRGKLRSQSIDQTQLTMQFDKERVWQLQKNQPPS